MKKFRLKATLVVALAAVAGYGVYTAQSSQTELSDTALANVEALAREEGFNDCLGCKYVSQNLCKTFGNWGACLGEWDGFNIGV